MQVLNLFPPEKPQEFLIFYFDRNNFLQFEYLDTNNLDSEAESE